MLAHEIQELVAAAFAGKGGKGWVRADCPMCIEITGKDDMRQSMGLNMATGGFNCLAAETMVQTWDGSYPISDLAGGTHRLLTTCAQGHSRWVYAPVSSFGEQTLQDVVISRNGVEKTIRATPKHRWFVKSGQRFLERTTDQLKAGQYLRGVKLPHSGTLHPSPWVIKSVGAPGAPEEVFCATVEGFGCFALEDNLLTGNCFKCGTTGWLLPQLMDLQEWEVEDVDVEREPPQLATGFVPLYHGDGLGSSALEPARAYLRRRGITDEIGEAADIGTAVWGWLSGYVIVPIPNYENPEAPWKGWFARDYTGFKEQKHRYPKRMSRLDTLWNEQALWERTDEPVIVTEGILDALPYYPDGVACLGKPIDAHVQLFLRAQRPIVMCLDGDAHEEGWAYAMKLRFLGLRAFSVRLPPNQDPNSVDPQWLREQVQNAVEAGQD